MDKLILWMERAGGFFLFLIMALIAVSSTMRYLFNSPLPDADSIGRLLLGTVVFWGVAGASRHSDHIRVDLLWERLPHRGQLWVDRFASGFTLIALAVLTYAAFFKVIEFHNSREVTYDLRMVVWPYYAVAWLGLAVAVAVLIRALICRHHQSAE